MKFNLLHVYTLISVALVGCHAVTSEVYWKSMLPNTPIPKAIIDLLYNKESSEEKSTGEPWKPMDTGAILIYGKPATEDDLKNYENEVVFFLENDLHQSAEMNLHFIKRDNHKTTPLLPKQVADSIPFSSKNLPQIYNKFSIDSDSMEAGVMKQLLNDCENKGIEGEEKYCATSLESMVDFITTKLGEKVKAITTEVNSKEKTMLQKYVIEGSKKLAANELVICHKKEYPYAVFYCHKSVSNSAYMVSLVGADGTKVKAVSVCHKNTEKWNPKHFAFQVLKVKPGSVTICHFLPEDNVGWVPY